MTSRNSLKQVFCGLFPTSKSLFLILAAPILLSGCKLDQIKFETSKLKKEASLLEEQIRGMGLEQQMNIYEANDVKAHSFLLHNLKIELEQSQKNLREITSELEQKHKQLAEIQTYLDVYGRKNTSF